MPAGTKSRSGATWWCRTWRFRRRRCGMKPASRCGMKTTVQFSLNQPKNMKTTLTILGLALLILPAQGAALNTYPETNAAANVQLLVIVTNADGSFTTVRVPSVGGTDPALVTNGQTTFKMTNLTGSGSVIMAATSSGFGIQAQNTNGRFGNNIG